MCAILRLVSAPLNPKAGVQGKKLLKAKIAGSQPRILVALQPRMGLNSANNKETNSTSCSSFTHN